MHHFQIMENNLFSRIFYFSVMIESKTQKDDNFWFLVFGLSYVSEISVIAVQNDVAIRENLISNECVEM